MSTRICRMTALLLTVVLLLQAVAVPPGNSVRPGVGPAGGAAVDGPDTLYSISGAWSGGRQRERRGGGDRDGDGNQDAGCIHSWHSRQPSARGGHSQRSLARWSLGYRSWQAKLLTGGKRMRYLRVMLSVGLS